MATQLPQAFGKYILLNKIALGGMAEIFRAKTIGAEGFEKEVVIKRILPHFTEDENFVTMFIDEAKVSSGLNHPNIVQVFDFDTQDGTYYIAMEYVEGKDLKRLIDVGVKNGTPLSVPQVVSVIIEVCKGLHYAHTKKSRGQPLNIIHRDVSPHNVMVSFDGEVKVMDFGIAKAAARSTKTRAGTVKGKCAYMSPEQARGKQLDPRSDMFAVGVMMWEMLTHRRLFAGESDFETLTNVLKAEVPAPSSINKDVPPELDAILLRCLSKDRDERQSDCKELMRNLEQWFHSNVEDRDAGELDPVMAELFTDDIDALREMQQADARTNFFEASEMVRAQRGSSSSVDAQAASDLNLDAAPQSNDARTVALNVGAAVGAPAQAPLHGNATVALDPNAAGLLVPTGTQTRASGGNQTGLIIGLIIAAVAAVGFLVYKMESANNVETPPPPASQQTTISSGNSGSQNNGTQGQNARTTGESASATTGEGTTTAEGSDGSADGASGDTDGQGGNAQATGSDENDTTGTGTGGGDPTVTESTGSEPASAGTTTGVAAETTGPGEGTTGAGAVETPPAPVTAMLTLTSAPATAKIHVPALDKEGVGTLALETVISDRPITVIVTHPEYKQVIRTITVNSASQAMEIALTEKIVAAQPENNLAVLEVTVKPSTAKLTINGQDQTAPSEGSSAYQVQGYRVGEDVRIKVSARGFLDKEETLRITSNQMSRSYELRARPAAPTGPGTVRFNARPWARVSVRGKSCTTPCSLTLPSGRHRATFTQQGKTKTRSFRVRAGGTRTVVVDMNE